MTRTLVLDTSVVVAVLSPSDGLHQLCSDFLRGARAANERLLFPASAYAEALVGVRRPPGYDESPLVRFAREVATIAPLDADAASASATLRAQHLPALRLPDALIIGTAIARGADAVVTTDRSWVRFSPLVEVLR